MSAEDLYVFETDSSSKETPLSAERRQVLEMLAQGKITPEDADRLLDKLESAAPPAADPSAAGLKMIREVTGSADRVPANPKFLRVQVDSSDGDKVNIRVPLALVRTGVKLSAMMPKDANETLSEKGIDLSNLSSLKGEELIEALRDLTVDVNSSDGDKVRIFCE